MAEINDLLDAQLDDLADLPENKPFPNGAYAVTVNLAAKEINKKPAVEMKMKLLEVIELSSTEDPAPEAGAESNVLFILKNNDGSANEIAQGQLKKVLQALQPTFGGSTPKEVMENSKNASVAVVVKAKKDKEDNMRQQIISVTVA
jgi:hypothetical protein